jgi:hypothetical protein
MYMHALTARDLEWMRRLEKSWRRSYFAELTRLLAEHDQAAHQGANFGEDDPPNSSNIGTALA